MVEQNVLGNLNSVCKNLKYMMKERIGDFDGFEIKESTI
jgi:hypothetical protein